MKITTWTIQMHRTIAKFVTQNKSRGKETLSKMCGFPKNLSAHALLSKVPKQNTITLVQHCFFQSNLLKGNGPSMSEHFNHLSILFQF